MRVAFIPLWRRAWWRSTSPHPIEVLLVKFPSVKCFQTPIQKKLYRHNAVTMACAENAGEITVKQIQFVFFLNISSSVPYVYSRNVVLILAVGFGYSVPTLLFKLILDLHVIDRQKNLPQTPTHGNGTSVSQHN